jgi:hypothetical protein
MALFRKSAPTIESLQADLDVMRTKHRDVSEQLAVATNVLNAAVAERRESLMSVDPADVDRLAALDGPTTAARARMASLTNALQIFAERITACEEMLAIAKDKIAREGESKLRTEQAAALEQAHAVYKSATKALAEACAPIATVTSEGVSIGQFALQAAAQIETATVLALAELRSYARDVACGARPMKIQPQPRVEPPAPVTDPGPHVSIYVLQDSKWAEPDGTVKTAPKFGEASCPIHIAERAIAKNFAAPYHSERAERLRAAFGLIHGLVDAASAVDLEFGGEPSGVVAEVIEDGTLPGVPGAQVTIGAPRTMSVAGNAR